MAMSSDHWGQLKELFRVAIEHEPSSRAAYLDQACRDDPALREEIESLLASHDQADTFIEKPAFGNTLTATTELPVEEIEGRRIGSYQLIREIGRGGMGTVYLARRADEQYEKLVAMKVVRRGLDTDDIVRRFRNERQILASLDHPNIARLVDGGTTDDGLPYLVMEFVEGTPVTDYCDQHRLTTNERLQLFRTICAAVQHAHQNLVVHRDLKPSNILITPDGVPKLLDFGIAKVFNLELAGSQAEHTRTELRVLTPDYASPEQVRGETLTTTSDVYSLGVLLYELLTGHRPYRSISTPPHQLARIICEQEPAKPSTTVANIELISHGEAKARESITPESVSNARNTQPEKLRRALSGDPDNIVLMALRKEPSRRYASVDQFSEDIRRYLEGLPVVARKDTFKYRTTKFIKRHTVGVAAAALVALSLIIGITVSIREARVAREQAQRAGRVSAFMRNIFLLPNKRFNSPGRDLEGDKMNVGELLDEASKRIDTELTDQPDVRAELHHTLGDTYLIFNRLDAAEQNFRAALELSRAVYGERNPKVAQELYYLAATAIQKDETSNADELFRQAIAMMRATDKENANLPFMLHDYAGLRLNDYGDSDTAEALFRESLALFQRKYGEEYMMVPQFSIAFAQIAETRNEWDKAEGLCRDAIARFQRLSSSTNQNYQPVIDAAKVAIAGIKIKNFRYADAEAILREVLDRADKSEPGYYSLVSSCYGSLSQIHYLKGEYDKAEAESRRELEIERSSLPAGHRGLIGTLCALSQILSKEGKTPEAISRYEEAHEIYKRRVGDAFRNTYRDAYLKGTLAQCLTTQKRFAEAEPFLVESYVALNSRLGQRDPRTQEALRRLIGVYESWGKPTQATQYRAQLLQ